MSGSIGRGDMRGRLQAVGPPSSPGRRSRGLPPSALGRRPDGHRRVKRILTVAVLGLICAGCTGSPGTTTAPGANPGSPAASSSPAPTGLVKIGAGLQGPSGLTATIHATGLVNASAFAVDGQDRLWVATGAFEDDGSDAIYLVTSASATPIEVVADLHTPLGLLWVGDELFVASKERVEAFGDFDGSTFASRRTVLTFPAGVGELNGLAQAPDGRIVLGISAPTNASAPTSPYSAAVVSFLPDGSDLRVEADGIRAPIGLAYVPRTTDLLVTMNQRDDLGDETPGDWLGLVESGQDWGFPDCYGQGGSACASAPGPLAVLDTHAAVSGLAIVTGQLGTSVGLAAIVAEWSTGKVLGVGLSVDGEGGYVTEVEPILTGLQHPVPLALASDGTLFVGDWGTGTIYAIHA